MGKDLCQTFGDEDGRLETAPDDVECESQLGIAGPRQIGGREEAAEVVEDGLNPSGRMIFEKNQIVESQNVADDEVDEHRSRGDETRR